ncbi:hypothetical protein C6P40_002814 [Pichia californica]|uniref:Uncharacterized protein n=1 Tax=Pichia californica TaxID=460514 RepID=A0A9P6WI09_9ASCO|nr:hypothetical protein C6P42_002279 [[Candida] californica]KAG0687134.1 hypothetical protein C6P40_002814 [[Candida] californica]
MTAAASGKPEGYTVEKKMSVTEDLHISTSSTKSVVNEAAAALSSSALVTKKTLENIQEGKIVNIPVATAKIAPISGAISKSTMPVISASHQQRQQHQPVKTFAEITQELKGQLRKTSSEIEKSDIEFDRLVGNLEKRIQALKLRLNSSR